MNPFDRLPSLPADGYATHEVMNQATPFTGHNAFTGDTLLTEIAGREKIGWADGLLAEAGKTVASAGVATLARDANRQLPELRSHDRFGHRIDEIEFHPAWHQLMSLAIGHGTHALSWTARQPGAHVARGMLSYLWNQGENGICCPLGMTYSAIPALRLQPELAAVWEPFILSTRYDPTAGPMQGKTGGTVGMTLTEKQAGSDLRATQTTARPAAARRGPGEAYLIDGHKWFFSVPHSDVFVTLAHTDRGLSCFLLPGWLPDGSRNRLLIQRLKDKCGNKSNASSEIEYRGALGWLVGEEGQGVKAALAMTHLTRLDFAIGSAGLMRRALSEAIHHTSGRRAFQRSLIDQPLMQNVIADLALEVEAATMLAFRLARAVDDEEAGDASAALLVRIGTPVGKYFNCKRVVGVVHEALECHGGNGFIEEGPMARLYREAPLNGIWEGSGNIIALDVLRAAAKSPESVPAFLDEVRLAKGGDRRLDRAIDRLETELSQPEEHEARARRIVEKMAIALQAGLLIRHSPAAVADAFCATRLGDEVGTAYGSLPAGLDQRAIVERARMAPDPRRRMQDFKDKVVLVTGGATGIGRAAALAFGRRGARVVMAGRRQSEGDKAVAALAEIGASGRFVATDVTKADDLASLHRNILEEHGRLDVAFNNAGYQEPRAPLAEQDSALYDRVFDTNVRSVYLSLQHQVRIMAQQGGGAIVVNTSVSGLRNPNPGLALYSASKAALVSLTRSAAMEYAEKGVRINAVAPGRVVTDMMLASKIMDMSAVAAGLPLRRMGRPEEVAEAVVWLASDAASFVVGHVLCTDGGFMAL